MTKFTLRQSEDLLSALSGARVKQDQQAQQRPSPLFQPNPPARYHGRQPLLDMPMAIEDAFVYVLSEIPTLILAKVLRQSLSITPKQAQSTATVIFFALLLGACFTAWFFSQQPPVPQ